MVDTFDDLAQQVIAGDDGEQWRGVERHGRTAGLAAVDRTDEGERIGSGIEGDVDGEERTGGEAEHADRAAVDTEPLGLLAGDGDRPPPVVGRCVTSLEVGVRGDEVGDGTGQLRRRPRDGEHAVHLRHHRFERGLVVARRLHPVLEEEGGEAFGRQPTGDVYAFVVPGVDRPAAARHDDHADPVRLALRRVDAQRRVGDVAQERRAGREPGRGRIGDLVADAFDHEGRPVGPQADGLGSHADMMASATGRTRCQLQAASLSRGDGPAMPGTTSCPPSRRASRRTARRRRAGRRR